MRPKSDNCSVTSAKCKVHGVQSRHLHFALCTAFVTIVIGLSLGGISVSQETTPPPNKPNLANDQDSIKARYKRFNLTLQQMAEILRKQDPERADLLFRALGKSQETRIEDQMNLIFSLLNKEQPQLGEAIDRQEELVGQLKNLLDLLQSEDRRSEIEKEKQRLQDLLKDINKMIGKEKDVRAGTERGDDTKKLAGKQEDIAKDADKLGQKIDKQDAEKNGEPPPNSKSQKSDSKPGDPKSTDQKPSDKDGKPMDDKSDKPAEDQKPGDTKKPDDKDKNKDKNDNPSDMNKSDKPMDGPSRRTRRANHPTRNRCPTKASKASQWMANRKTASRCQCRTGSNKTANRTTNSKTIPKNKKHLAASNLKSLAMRCNGQLKNSKSRSRLTLRRNKTMQSVS